MNAPTVGPSPAAAAAAAAAAAPGFVEALGQLQAAAAAGPRLDVGTVTEVSGARARVDLGEGNPIWCNKLRSYTPAAGEAVLVAIIGDTEPVVLGHLGGLAEIVAASSLNVTGAAAVGGHLTAGSADVAGHIEAQSVAAWGNVSGNGLLGNGMTIDGPATIDGNANVGSLSCGTTAVNSGGFTGASASIGGIVINGGGITTYNKNIVIGDATMSATHGTFWTANVASNINIGTLSCGTTAINSGGFTGASASIGGNVINGGGINTYNKDVYMRDLHARDLYYAPPGSERRLKRNITKVERGHLDTVLKAPIYHFQYDPAVPEVADQDPEVWHRGPMVDDLPDHVISRMKTATDDPDEPTGPKSPGLVGMVLEAWGAIQELHALVDQQRRRGDAAELERDELRTRMDAIERRLTAIGI